MGILDSVIGGLLGGNQNAGPMGSILGSILGGGAQRGGPMGGMGGMGGGMGGGGLGGMLGGGGLGGLIDALTRSGHGDIAQSWVNHGENRPVAPNQLMDALGPDTVDQLQQQTGMPREELLSELSHTLPHVVDQLTPEGRLPTDDEMQRW